MAYNRENISRIREEYRTRRARADEEAARRRQQLQGEIPSLCEIDAAIASIGARVMQCALAGGDVEGAVLQMKKDHTMLREGREELLRQHGYAPDYTDIHYRCEACLDTGFIGTKMCECMRRELVELGYASSGIAALMEKQSFDTFALSYYTGDNRRAMEANLRILRAFAEDFGAHRGENYLMIGATGLGKTHLSTSVAKTVIDGGHDVVYDTAQGLFSAFEAKRFAHDGDADTDKYLTAELLIIDDLGTEVANQFTVSCLYTVINTRVNAGRSTIINTNLSHSELRARYADRITSRLFGEFRPLAFRGEDIRAQKLKQ